MDLFTEAEKYMHGNGVKCDYAKATELYAEAARAGDAAAARILAHIYEDGEIARKDLNLATEYYILAAENGGAKEKFALALIYDKGEITEKNIDMALKYYLEAAELGYERAQNNLANIYKKKGDYINALRWYEKAAAGGSSAAKQNLEAVLSYDCGALHTLAVYYSGNGDFEKSEEYFKRACELNHIPSMEAYAGILAKKGELKSAEKIYRRCIANGNAAAALLLGDMYSAVSCGKAEKYYKYAYIHKVPQAAEKYAACLTNPERVFKRIKKSGKILKK